MHCKTLQNVVTFVRGPFLISLGESKTSLRIYSNDRLKKDHTPASFIICRSFSDGYSCNLRTYRHSKALSWSFAQPDLTDIPAVQKDWQTWIQFWLIRSISASFAKPWVTDICAMKDWQTCAQTVCIVCKPPTWRCHRHTQSGGLHLPRHQTWQQCQCTPSCPSRCVIWKEDSDSMLATKPSYCKLCR